MSRRRLQRNLDGPIGPVVRRELRAPIDIPDLSEPILSRVYDRRASGPGGPARRVVALFVVFFAGLMAANLIPRGTIPGAMNSIASAFKTPNAQRDNTRLADAQAQPPVPGEISTALASSVTSERADPSRRAPARGSSELVVVQLPGVDDARFAPGSVAGELESTLRGDNDLLALR